MVGPDGTGKSSLCDALIAGVLADGPVLRVHHRFGVLPTRGGDTSDISEPHGEQPYGTVVSTLKVLALFVDYWLGGSFGSGRSFAMAAGSSSSGVVGPRRRSASLPPPTGGRLVRALGRLLPAADLILVLEAPAATLLARKAELPEAELVKQMQDWREFRPSRVRRVYVNASVSLDEVVAQAEQHVRPALL